MLDLTPLTRLWAYLYRLGIALVVVWAANIIAHNVTFWKDPEAAEATASIIFKGAVLSAILITVFKLWKTFFSRKTPSLDTPENQLRFGKSYASIFLEAILYNISEGIDEPISNPKNENTPVRIFKNLTTHPIEAYLRWEHTLPACISVTDTLGRPSTFRVRTNSSIRLLDALDSINYDYDYDRSFLTFEGELKKWEDYAAVILTTVDSHINFPLQGDNLLIEGLLNRAQFVVGGRSLSLDEVKEWARDLLITEEVSLER